MPKSVKTDIAYLIILSFYFFFFLFLKDTSRRQKNNKKKAQKLLNRYRGKKTREKEVRRVKEKIR